MTTEQGQIGTLDLERLAVEGAGSSPARSFLRSLLKRKLAVAALCYITVFYLAGIFAPLIAPYSYTGNSKDLNVKTVLQGPSSKHWLGTDRNGRDLLSRAIYAARTTFEITVVTAIAGSLLIGPALGLLAGYKRGLIDTLINRFGEAVSSLPPLLIAFLLAGTLRPRFDAWLRGGYNWPFIGSSLRSGIGDLLFISIILSSIGWIGDERLIRSLTLSIRRSEYVVAAESMGASTARILFSHVLPNVRHLIVLGVTTALGAVALSEIALSFFGLGVRPPTPSFGAMIFDASGVRQVQAHPNLLLVPGVIAVLLFVSFALFGDALNDVLNPRTR